MSEGFSYEDCPSFQVFARINSIRMVEDAKLATQFQESKVLTFQGYIVKYVNRFSIVC